MAIKGFTKAENSILFTSNLSNNAKLVYIQIKYYSSIDGFKLSKTTILKDSQLSVNTFDKVIKELRYTMVFEKQSTLGMLKTEFTIILHCFAMYSLWTALQ